MVKTYSTFAPHCFLFPFFPPSNNVVVLLNIYKGTTIDQVVTVDSDSDEEQEQSELTPRANILQIEENKEDDFALKYGKSNNIMVVVRQRPLNRKEKAINSRNIIRIIEEKVVVLLNPGVAVDDYLRHERARRTKEKTYAFDYAFDENCSNQKVYDNTISLLLNGVINGYNATVFAYGATGAGKTYTMTGTRINPGLMVLTLQDLFKKVNENTDGTEYSISISYLEVYNEHIRDLLNFASGDKYLDLREDPIKGIVVSGITEIYANSAMHILELLQKGNKNRTTECTAANTHSSRSHAILQIVIQNKDVMNERIKVGKLNMIDLAGSERASLTSNRGARLLEGANINRSLLSLANCINALAKGQRKRFVPYRDSKLTRLLKDSLGGNCRTVMIANASPADFTYEDTCNTLKYANRAKNIKTKVYENVMTANDHVAQYDKIIKDLRSQVFQLKQAMHKQQQQQPPPPSIINTDIYSNLNKQQLGFLNKMRQEILNKFSLLITLKSNYVILSNDIVQLVQRTPEELDDLDDIKRKVSEKDRMVKEIKELTKSLQQYKDKCVCSSFFKDDINKPLLQMMNMEYKVHKMQIDRVDLEQHSKLSNIVIRQKDIAIQVLERQLQIRDELLSQHFEENKENEFPKSYIKIDELKKQNRFNRKTLNHLNDNHENLLKADELLVPLPTKQLANQKIKSVSRNVTILASINNHINKQQYPSKSNIKQQRTRSSSCQQYDLNTKPINVRVNNNNVVSSGFNKNKNSSGVNKTLYPSFRSLRQHKLKQLQLYQDAAAKEMEQKQHKQGQYSTHSKSIYSNHRRGNGYNKHLPQRNPHKRNLPRINNKDTKQPRPPNYGKSRSMINKESQLKSLKFKIRRSSDEVNTSYQALHSDNTNSISHSTSTNIRKPNKNINVFSRHHKNYKKSRSNGYNNNNLQINNTKQQDKNDENNTNNLKVNNDKKSKFDLNMASPQQNAKPGQQRMLFRHPITSKLKTLNQKQKQREKRLRNVYLG